MDIARSRRCSHYSSSTRLTGNLDRIDLRFTQMTFFLSNELTSPWVPLVTFGNTTLDHAFLNVLKLYDVARRHLLSCGPSLDPQSRTIFPNLVREKPTLLARGASGPIKGALDLAEYFVSYN